MVEKNKKLFGLLFLVLVSSIFIWLVYGEIIKSPNFIFFAPWGDGLKCTYGSYFHYEFDTSYMHTYSMNYPFGESVFFTDSQLLVVNTLKLLSKAGLDFTSNITGIMNIWMIMTILIGIAVFYFILLELKLPVIYSLIVSIIVIFLSPQIERFSGHYNLAIIFLLPLLFLLLIKYYKNPGYKLAIITGIVAFVAMYFHGYYYAFFSIWTIIMVAVLYFTEKDRFNGWKPALHIGIMVVLPFILFSLVTREAISDRTIYPWGGIQSSSYLESIFIPGRLNYPGILKFGRGVSYYIGLPCTIVFFILVGRYFKNRFKGKRAFFYESKVLNALLIAALIAVVYSLCWPFKFKGSFFNLEWMMNYMGPMRQFRGTGRFSWLFYYTMNVVTYYFLWHWYKTNKNKIRTSILILVLLFSSFEAFMNIKNRGHNFNHRIAEFEDVENKLPANQWVNEINVNEFQAILPLPYYHVGSEAYWISGSGGIEKASFLAGWKTGLPLMSVMLSRTSISQTLESIELIYEPLSQFNILDKFHNNKDLLLLIANKGNLKDSELRIKNYAEYLTGNDNYGYYRLKIDSLHKLQHDYESELRNKVIKAIGQKGDYLGDTSIVKPIYLHYGEVNPYVPNDSEAFSFKAKKNTVLLDTVLFSDTAAVNVSFWFKDMRKDLLPRTRVNIRFFRDGHCVKSSNLEIFRNTKYVSKDGWGLYETTYQPHAPYERITISFRNKYTTNQRVFVDEVLIRRECDEILFQKDSLFVINNRNFFED